MLKNFFDFYLANLIYDFSHRKDHIYYSSKLERIVEIRDRINDDFYTKVRDNLHYSILREFRHCEDGHFDSSWDKANAEKYETIISKYRKYYDTLASVADRGVPTEKDIKEMIKVKIDLKDVFEIFNAHDCWDMDYGGKCWAEATNCLLNLPKTDKEKIVWVDRVLDLYHNSGPLLNKTKFNILFMPKTCGKGKKKKTALNYRRYATATDLAAYASTSVKKLFFANKLGLPANI